MRLLSTGYDLVIYVCKVTHILYTVPQVLEVTVQDVKGNVNSGMANVSPGGTQANMQITPLESSQATETDVNMHVTMGTPHNAK